MKSIAMHEVEKQATVIDEAHLTNTIVWRSELTIRNAKKAQNQADCLKGITTNEASKKVVTKDKTCQIIKTSPDSLRIQANLAALYARNAEGKADRLECLAKELEIETEAFACKTSVEDEHINSYKQKVKVLSEARKKYETVSEQKNDLMRKLFQSQAKLRSSLLYELSTKINTNDTNLILITHDIFVQKDDPEIIAMQSKVNEIYTQIRKIKIELKKAELALNTAVDAIATQIKHIQSSNRALAQIEAKEVEANARRAEEEANAKRAEALARQSEEKVIRSCCMDEADSPKSITIHEVEKQATAKDKTNLTKTIVGRRTELTAAPKKEQNEADDAKRITMHEVEKQAAAKDEANLTKTIVGPERKLTTPKRQKMKLNRPESTKTHETRKKAAVRNETCLIKKAKLAAHYAKRAQDEANRLETLAKKIDIRAEAFAYKASVEDEHVKTYEQKAQDISEARKRYETASEQKDHWTHKLAESRNKLAKLRSSSKKVSPEDSPETIAIQSEINEIDTQKRKTAIECKRAELELKAANDAITSQKKHIESRDQAKALNEAKKIEANARREEAGVKRAEALARRSEEKAIKSGRMDEAESFKRKALSHRARAVEIESENREKYNQKRRKPEDIPHRQGAQNSIYPPNERKAQLKSKKHLSAEGLIKSVKEVFEEIHDPNQSKDPNQPKRTLNDQITLCDCLMSGLAIFGQKCASLLQFDQDFRGDASSTTHNLKKLYKINRVPSDTYIRERIDVIHPDEIRPVFKKLFSLMQRGKELESYAFLDGAYLVSGDGTGYFSSDKVHCADCCKKQHKDGTVSYYHQMMSAAIVHPDHATVIPFCPEPIVNADGSTKNDCERNAAARLYRHIRREHPHLPLIVTEDALGANGPHIRLLQELKMQFIIVAKPDGNKSIFEFLNGVERQKYNQSDKENSYEIEFVNDIPLNDAHPDIKVNFIEARVKNHHSGEVYHNTWITSIPVTMDNVYRLYQGGRAKWKIENETFNTLKNQGYRFEHNFGHGKEHLSTNFAFLMFLAFLIDQIQQSCCGLFQAAWAAMKSKTRLWSKMRAYFMTLLIDSWEELWKGIIFGLQTARLVPLAPSDTPKPEPNSS